VKFDFTFLETLSHSLGWVEYYAWHIIGFLLVYFSLAGSAHVLIRHILIKRSMGSYIDARPLKPGQIRAEIRHSFASMFFLSFFAVLALKLEQYGRLTILWSGFSPVRVIVDVLLFAAWNEIYFFACHWLLHRPFFFRHVHNVHHYSVTTSPFSSLSFHWFEALLYSGTMILAMGLHSFDILAIMLWPGISLIANTFGHSNFTWRSNRQGAAFMENNWRHGAHHKRINKNFSYWAPWPDSALRWLQGDKSTGKPGE
jgi:Delta7-sterol 5-desaturase